MDQGNPNPALWIIRPQIDFITLTGAITRNFEVSAWRVHLRLIQGDSGCLIDGQSIDGMIADAAAFRTEAYDITLGGLFDAHARPVLVQHVFEFSSALGGTLRAVITQENLIAWNR